MMVSLLPKKGKYTIKPGENHFNAKQALSFVRERKAFVEGDTIVVKIRC